MARWGTSGSPILRSWGNKVAEEKEVGRLLVDRALLEGDFVLRSGKRSSWYLDKYRFETDPGCSAPSASVLPSR